MSSGTRLGAHPCLFLAEARPLFQLNTVLSLKDYCWGSGHSLGLGLNARTVCRAQCWQQQAGCFLGTGSRVQQVSHSSSVQLQGRQQKGTMRGATPHTPRKQHCSFQQDLGSKRLALHTQQHPPAFRYHECLPRAVTRPLQTALAPGPRFTFNSLTPCNRSEGSLLNHRAHSLTSLVSAKHSSTSPMNGGRKPLQDSTAI